MAEQQVYTAVDAIGKSKSNRNRWIYPEAGVSDYTRKLLETYGKVPPEKVEEHVRTIQDKAEAIHPYPCIGLWRFMEYGIAHHKVYKADVLPRMLSGEQIYLDLGCAIGQDIRVLADDGVDTSKTYGSDLRLDYLELGYELFNDKDTLKTTFFEADVFDPESRLKDLKGQVDSINASAFVHLFSLEDQKTVCKSIAGLLKPQRDSLIFGRQMGNKNPGEFERLNGQGTRYRHDMETWAKLWKEVGEDLGVEFRVDGEVREIGKIEGRDRPRDEGATWMEFAVRRL